ncbi:MAG: ATP-binding cassette domain-containing protein [Lacunisphaera sp.]
MIEVENLTRVFRTYKKQPGFWGGVKGLFKREFEETRAADGVSFSIKEGEFVGFLGPNGAGKTTTLKMLSGLIYPTSGTARRRGLRPVEARECLPPPLRARARPEEPAVVGPARDRVLHAAACDLRPAGGPVQGDARRTRHAARRRSQAQRDGPRTLAGRAYENGADRRADPPAARAVFSTSPRSAST